MNQKNLLVLAVVTVAVVAAALVRRGAGATETETLGEGTPFVEGLIDDINEVTAIEVSDGARTVTAVREGEGWRVEELGGYPARFKTVKEALMGVAGMKTVEAKTSDPERHADLGLEEPSEEGDGSTRVVVRGEGGTELASIVLGDTKPGRNPKLYARRSDEDQTWLVKGSFRGSSDPMLWVEKQILNLPGDRVAEVTVRHADGEVVTARRARKGEPNMTVENVPEGRELSAETIANSQSNALAYLTFDRVRPASEIDFASPVATTVLRTWDGLVVEADLAEEGLQTWVRFTCRYEEPPAPAEPESEEDDDVEDEHADHDGHDHGAESADAGEDEGPDPEEVRAEVAELNGVLAGWAFALPGYKQSSLQKRMEDLLQEVEGETTPSEDLEAIGEEIFGEDVEETGRPTMGEPVETIEFPLAGQTEGEDDGR